MKSAWNYSVYAIHFPVNKKSKGKIYNVRKEGASPAVFSMWL